MFLHLADVGSVLAAMHESLFLSGKACSLNCCLRPEKPHFTSGNVYRTSDSDSRVSFICL